MIKPLGTMLTTLPATTARDTPRAGPSFAFYRSINYLPHRDAAWAVSCERFDELAEFSEHLPGLDVVHATLITLSGGLKQHVRSPRSTLNSPPGHAAQH